MKRLFSILLLLLFVFAIGGCNSVDKGTDSKALSAPIGESASVETASIDTDLIPDGSKVLDELNASSDETSANSKGTTESDKTSSGSSSKLSESQSTSKSTNSSGSKTTSGNTSDSNTEKKKDKENSTEVKSDPNRIIVTISIDTKTAYKKGYVKNEWIVGKTKVELEKGSSVWDALNKVTKSKGIPVVKRGSGDSLYISHINSLGEFDFEQGSGWMYNVNGTYPNYGCGNSRSVLKDGDVIQWRFTLNLGKDLGASQS